MAKTGFIAVFAVTVSAAAALGAAGYHLWAKDEMLASVQHRCEVYENVLVTGHRYSPATGEFNCAYVLDPDRFPPAKASRLASRLKESKEAPK